MITSHCNCGDLVFHAATEPVFHGYCHCHDCRAATTQPYSRIAFFDTEHVTISGRCTSQAFTVKDGITMHRDSCANCGTVLFDRSERFPDIVGVVNAPLSGTLSQPSFHMWVSSKLAGLVIDDGLIQFSTRPDPSAIVTAKPT